MNLVLKITSVILLFVAAIPTIRAEDVASSVIVDPPSLSLSGPASRHYLLVHERVADGVFLDLTRSAKYQVADPKIAEISDRGLVRGKADGATTIRVEVRGLVLSVPVVVRGASLTRTFHFENDISPLLGRFGCNASGCHGKAEGQNGFKLSVFGFDPPADFNALIKEGRGRRIFPAVPEKSLLLTKAAGQVPHGGGLRIQAKSEPFDTIRAWIAVGAPFGDANAPRVQSIRIEPAERIMPMHGEQQLRVMAKYSDGRDIDVTTQARFQTNNETVGAVEAEGIVKIS
ncbi:MAG: Ig-like domain-containing protein, partial [Planctomycetes bacterium]|nr:Ig-like domain-containing protein [Planctomycetota bacterium]